MKEKLYYLKYAATHPFDSFYEIRFRGKGSLGIAAVLVTIYCLLQCAAYQYTGFIMNKSALHEMNSISLFISTLSIIVLFTFSNWSVTTLLGGKGNTRNIFIVIGYSMLPMIFTEIITIFVSNFIIEEEIMILVVVRVMGIVWFAFLAISGLCVIHEYGLGKTLASLFLTLAAAIIIVFLLTLVFSLEEKMVNFISSVASELIRRIN